MPTTSTILQFAAASLLLAVAPGPSIALLLAVGAERGRSAAALTAVGLAVGTLAWVVVTATGLGALVAARPTVVDVVAVVGGLYLLWLAARAVHGAVDQGSQDEPDPRSQVVSDGGGGAVVAESVSAGRSLVDGVVVNLLNPSLPVFLTALLPPFLAPARGPVWQQILVLGGVLATVSTVVNVVWGLLGAGAGAGVRRAVGDRWAGLVVAATYATLGVFVLLSPVVG